VIPQFTWSVSTLKLNTTWEMLEELQQGTLAQIQMPILHVMNDD